MEKKLFNDIFRGKRILVTGHTGFKGSWMVMVLHRLGADVFGFALDPPTTPSLYKEARIEEFVTSFKGDVRDYETLSSVIQNVKPEIIFHMAAQSLVLESYRNPVETYAVNVMGTVNLLEAIRHSGDVKAVVNITTDKCYENKEWHWGYRESEPMGGFDPYSNSKGCSELVTSAFRNSFFNTNDFERHGVSIATARAGNVIGGGDWASDRLIPDFIRAIANGQILKIRSPQAIRPWQFVLEPLSGYLTLAEMLLTHGPENAGAWNFGPDDRDAKNVEWITQKICELWGNGATYTIDRNPQPHEANYLKLDCSKAKAELNWNARWDIERALTAIVEWHKLWITKGDVRQISMNQIEEYFGL